MPDEFAKLCTLTDLLNRHPEGMTAQQVTEAMGGNLSTVTGRLSKLHAYGFATRVRLKRVGGSGSSMYVYRYKPPVPVTPRTEQHAGA